jgi:hypothetical protein
VYSIGGVGLEIEISGYRVLIDDEDWDRIKGYRWELDKRSACRGFNYLQTKIIFDGKGAWWSMHRMIMGVLPKDPRWVDHINHNTLDNRRENLRFASRAENVRNGKIHVDNKCGYKGVVYRNGFYRAYIISDGVFYQVKSSKDIIECARWYDMAAMYLHKEFASTNFPRETYSEHDMNKVIQAIHDYKYSNNTSGYRGVSYRKRNSKWIAYIDKNKKRIYLGDYDDIKDAAIIRDRKAIELYGDKAILNFPIETYKELQDEQEATN